MSAKQKNKSVKFSFSLILKLILTALIIIAVIFAVDYCSIKTKTQNAATEKVHETREQIQTVALELLNEVRPPQPVSEPKTQNASDSKTNDIEVRKTSFETNNSSSPPVLVEEKLELPLCAASKTGTAKDHQIRRFGNFVICYRESYEQAEWAAYCLEKEELVKNASRGDDFRADPEITTGSATLADYKKSGYDRGHLAPAADFAFSEEAMSESFFLSNMSPQAPGLNREIWQYLEGQVRTWADRFGKVYVITGPVLEKPAEAYDYIGENQVSIPEFYYKVLLVPTHESLMSIGFIIPNKKCKDTFWDYAVTIDEVERRTGLDFYSLLDDHLEDKLESEYALENWK